MTEPEYANVRLFFVVAFLLVSQCGCLSLTTMETGRTVGKGASDLSLSVTSGRYAETSIGGPNDDADLKEGETNDNDISTTDYYPVIEAGGVLGVGERTDIGVRLNSSFFASASMKHQLIGSKTSLFATSIGVRGGVNPMAALVGGVLYGYGIVPVYLSFHPPNSRFAVYAVPQYAITNITVLATPPGGGRSNPVSWGYTGITGGVAYGERYRIAIEATHVGIDTKIVSQVAVGFSTRVHW